MRPWGPILAIAAGCAVGNACLVDLEHTLACGDGYVDALAGEQCEPGDRQSYIDACVGTSRPFGDGACDPETCQIINTKLQCVFCGDGLIDAAAGEECDGSTVGVPCWGEGTPSCKQCKIDFSTCDNCGNGVVDEGEECDDIGMDGGIVIPRPCAGTIELEPLRSPYMNLPYSSGSAVSCLPNCTYDRTSCGYCGNGNVDPPLRVSIMDQAVSLAEVCDGDMFDKDLLAEEYPLCEDLGAQANVACEPNCLDYVERAGAACCLPKGSVCPADGDELRCCYEYAHPTADTFCLPVILPTEGATGGDGNAVVCR
jgi:hypothetical protein